jgi:uncharacterized membrane protein
MSDIHLHWHPMLVHFPVALFVCALGLEAVSLIFKKERLHATAVVIYILAALSTPFAALTGLWEAWELHLNHPVLNLHRTFAFWTMGVSLVSLAVLGMVRKRAPSRFRLLFILFAVTTAMLVSLAAHNGGRMVFEYGIGVEGN